MPAVEAFFGHLGEIRRVAGRTLSAADLADAELLLVRSVTQVNETLLKGSAIKFVGTATIGVDHVDTQWLAEQGIGFSSAPGCNADGVVEYVLSSIWQLAAEQGFDPLQKTWGVIGAGNVGGRLVKRLQQAGIEVLVSDPPRAEREGDSAFTQLDDLLAQADIICAHTPLTKAGEHATHHLLNAQNLSTLKPDAILLNAGRGPVIDNLALKALLQQRPDLTCVLDVWEHEPRVDAELAQHVAIGTPHIAGYSLDGKIRGTWMLYEAYCRWAGLASKISFESVLPNPDVTHLGVTATMALSEPMRVVYDPYRDDRVFRAMLKEQDQPAGFDRLRKQYPVRREFASLELQGALTQAQQQSLTALGFSVQVSEVD